MTDWYAIDRVSQLPAARAYSRRSPYRSRALPREHAAARLVRDAGERPLGVVEVPVRVVRAVEERLVGVNDLEQRVQVRALLRLDERLGRQTDVVDDVLARQTREPRHLVAQGAPVLVEAPHDVEQPGDAALADDDLEAREALEDALTHEADRVPVEHLAQRRVPLRVVGVDASGQDRPLGEDPVDRVRVDGDRKPVADCRLVDREVVAVAHEDVQEREVHLDEAGPVGDAVDLRRGQLRVLRRDDERAAVARIGLEPDLGQPVVVRRRDRRGEIRVRQAAEAEHAAADEHGPVDAERVEVIAADERRVAARHRSVLRHRVPAHDADRVRVEHVLRNRDVRGVDLLRPGLGVADAEPLLPGLREVRLEIAEPVAPVRVDVAVDDRELGLHLAGLAGLRVGRRHDASCASP